jgi:hypothetical protein
MALVTAACGGEAPAPLSPSPVNRTEGATIIGTVQSGGSPMLAVTTSSASLAGLTVNVVGTSISAAVSGTGQFTLAGVPSGQAQLKFSGPGVDATVAISVQGSETITITVALNGTRAEVKDEGHENHGDAELHGNVVGLAGSASAFEFRLGGRLVRGDAATQFYGDGNRDDTFAQLDNGDRVEVKGLSRDGFVYAQRIHINGGPERDDDGDDDGDDDDDGEEDEDRDGEAEISGTMAGLSGSCPSIRFAIGANQVATNGATEFSKVSCAALKNGDRVKVEGTRQPSGVILADEVKRQ